MSGERGYVITLDVVDARGKGEESGHLWAPTVTDAQGPVQLAVARSEGRAYTLPDMETSAYPLDVNVKGAWVTLVRAFARKHKLSGKAVIIDETRGEARTEIELHPAWVEREAAAMRRSARVLAECAPADVPAEAPTADVAQDVPAEETPTHGTCPDPACGRKVRIRRDRTWGAHYVLARTTCEMAGKPIDTPAPAPRVVTPAPRVTAPAETPATDTTDTTVTQGDEIMTFNIVAAVLARALAYVLGVVPRKPIVPVLSGVRIDAGPDGVVLGAHDYDAMRTVTVGAPDADVFGDGTATAVAACRPFAEWAKGLPATAHVVITVADGKITAVAGGARYVATTFVAEDYPSYPAAPAVIGSVDSREFADAVARVAPFASTEPTLPGMCVIRGQFGPDGITLDTTDRYRVGTADVQWAPVASILAPVSACIPSDMAAPVKAIAGEADRIEIGANTSSFEGHMSIRAGGYYAWTRLVDNGTYPPVRSLFPALADVDTVAEIDVKAVADAVKRAAKLGETKSTPVRLTFRADSVTVAIAGDGGDQVEELPAAGTLVTGEPMMIGVNPTYFVEALTSAVPTGRKSTRKTPPARARVTLVSSVRPMVVEEATDAPTVRTLVMPIRIDGEKSTEYRTGAEKERAARIRKCTGFRTRNGGLVCERLLSDAMPCRGQRNEHAPVSAPSAPVDMPALVKAAREALAAGKPAASALGHSFTVSLADVRKCDLCGMSKRAGGHLKSMSERVSADTVRAVLAQLDADAANVPAETPADVAQDVTPADVAPTADVPAESAQDVADDVAQDVTPADVAPTADVPAETPADVAPTADVPAETPADVPAGRAQDATVRDILSRATWSIQSTRARKGAPRTAMQILTLPAGRLDRETYLAVKAVAESLGGTWRRDVSGFAFEGGRVLWGGGRTVEPTVKLTEWLAQGAAPTADVPADGAQDVAEMGTVTVTGTPAVGMFQYGAWGDAGSAIYGAHGQLAHGTADVVTLAAVAYGVDPARVKIDAGSRIGTVEAWAPAACEAPNDHRAGTVGCAGMDCQGIPVGLVMAPATGELVTAEPRTAETGMATFGREITRAVEACGRPATIGQWHASNAQVAAGVRIVWEYRFTADGRPARVVLYTSRGPLDRCEQSLAAVYVGADLVAPAVRTTRPGAETSAEIGWKIRRHLDDMADVAPVADVAQDVAPSGLVHVIASQRPEFPQMPAIMWCGTLAAELSAGDTYVTAEGDADAVTCTGCAHLLSCTVPTSECPDCASSATSGAPVADVPAESAQDVADDVAQDETPADVAPAADVEPTTPADAPASVDVTSTEDAQMTNETTDAPGATLPAEAAPIAVEGRGEVSGWRFNLPAGSRTKAIGKAVRQALPREADAALRALSITAPRGSRMIGIVPAAGAAAPADWAPIVERIRELVVKAMTEVTADA